MLKWTFAENLAALRPGLRAMMIVVVAVLVTSAIMVAPAMPAESQARLVQLSLGKATVTVKVPLSKSETVRTDAGFVDVVVADPEIADVLPLTDRSLSVLGKKIGSTRLSIYAEGKQLLGVFDVEVSYDTSQLAAELSRQFPHASFRVSSINGRILLSGSAPDGVTLDKAVSIAKQFGPEVINSVKVSQPQQVLLEVRFVEAARTAGRELGINWDVVTSNLDFKTGVGLLGPNAPFGVMIGKLLSGGVDAEAIIRSLEERGVARRLAEPNLVALSGDTASFLAGGEFPFPVQSTNNTITIEFKKFGVGLAFTPTVTSSGVINLKIEPEVSQIDPTNSVRVGGVEIPSLIVRRANTTIELRDGQSFAVAGLLQSINEVNQQQLPWVGNIPILGALFRSAAYQKKETDLVIIVTPRLVRPMRPGDVVRTPLDNTLPPNDVDLFLHGVSELTPTMLRRARVQAGALDLYRPFTGHVIDLPQPIPQEVGHVVAKY
ncbi:MAG TPA: type II and III secretion system protein family protein [Xanthobacteraceae bacterium]